MGQGSSHTLPMQNGPPNSGHHPLGLILIVPGTETARLLFGSFFSHWGISEMEKLLWEEDGQELCLEGGVGTE